MGTACSFERCLPTSTAYSSDSWWIHTCRFVFPGMLGSGAFSFGTACSFKRCMPDLFAFCSAYGILCICCFIRLFICIVLCSCLGVGYIVLLCFPFFSCTVTAPTERCIRSFERSLATSIAHFSDSMLFSLGDKRGEER